MAGLRQRRGEEGRIIGAMKGRLKAETGRGGQDYRSNEGEETSRLVSIHLTSLQGEENKLQSHIHI